MTQMTDAFDSFLSRNTVGNLLQNFKPTNYDDDDD